MAISLFLRHEKRLMRGPEVPSRKLRLLLALFEISYKGCGRIDYTCTVAQVQRRSPRDHDAAGHPTKFR